MSTPMTSAKAQLGGIEIWLVEDVPAQRMLLSELLTAVGACVRSAADGAEFRTLLADEALPDLLLMDVELPDADGLVLVEDLPGPVPVVLLTATPDAERLARARAAGCAAVFDKSTSFRGLLAVLAELPGLTERAPCAPRRALAAEAPVALTERYMRFLAEQRLAFGLARDRGDLTVARSLAHRLCGTAVHFGLPMIGQAARDLIDLLRAEPDDGAIRSATTALDDALGLALENHHRARGALHPKELQSCAS